MVGPDGLEPSTPRLSSACSNQLSYEPGNSETMAQGIGGRPSFAQASEGILPLEAEKWSRPDSNRLPPACKAGALPAELRPRNGRKNVI